MNLPNKITVSRFFAPPLFVAALLYYDKSGNHAYYWIALLVFALAAISDGLDGYFARTLNLRSKLGTILDPLADKFFLNCAIIVLAMKIGPLYKIPLWFVILVFSRDLLIIGGGLLIRLFKGELEVVPNWYGKTAAVLQMATVIWILLKIPHPLLTLYTAAVFTIFSGLTYLRSGIRQLE